MAVRFGGWLLLAAWVAFPASAPAAPPAREVEVLDGLVRERDAPVEGKKPGSVGAKISFIDSPSAHCYQPNPAQNVCYVAWQYLSVSASPNYMLYLTVELDGRLVLNVRGFFQTSLYVDRGVAGPNGFRVACGALSDPETGVGNSYGYTIRAEDSAGLKTANYGTVLCPAFVP